MDTSTDTSTDMTMDTITGTITPTITPKITPTTTPAPNASEINDGGRKLIAPDPEACVNRPKRWEFDGHFYFLSHTVPQYAGQRNDWLDSRNLCRKYCMDSVSIETEAENDLIKSVLVREKLPYIWTSGRVCDFKGCENRTDLMPLITYGWFWPTSGAKLAPTDKKPAGWSYQPWGPTGHKKVPQPDNAEFDINNTTEACL